MGPDERWVELCLQHHFPAEEIPDAPGRAYHLAATPFAELLERWFPGAERAGQRRACAVTYRAEKALRIYARARLFPDVAAELERLAGMGIPIVLSTYQYAIVARSLPQLRPILPYFDRILGKEHGPKEAHLAEIRRLYPGSRILSVSDSPSDMRLPGTVPIGRSGAAAHGLHPPELLRFSGARHVVSSFRELPDIVRGYQEEPLLEAAR